MYECVRLQDYNVLETLLAAHQQYILSLEHSKIDIEEESPLKVHGLETACHHNLVCCQILETL